jgi:hypothetical protein
MIRLAGLAAVVLVGVSVPVSAHEGDGIITVESGDVTGSVATYQVRLTWQNDGHPALDATVTATALRAADGQAQTPVSMSPADEDGRYRASLELAPGDWTVRFTSVTPAGTTEVPLSIAELATTTTDATTTTTGATTSTSVAGVVVSSDDDSGLSTAAVVGLAAVGLVALAAIGLALRARSRPLTQSRAEPLPAEPATDRRHS